ncbi:GTD-binding domain [Dillenia turbinata]|uniref:GTD-binding domain n=1 Tax=Dillenia turbinata TaxID=194707 RepID=A0AAN8VL15_9MAGN
MGIGEGFCSEPCYLKQQNSRQVRLDCKSLITLYLELDEERSASAVTANNAMTMIIRLQAEKAAVQMEALQYQRMMEEQAEYDQEALQVLKDLLAKQEEEIFSFFNSKW